jgi:hypothetical protein
MRKIYTFLFLIFTFFSAQAQYCTNVGPSSTIDSNVESVILNGASGSINFIGCPGVIGLQDLTSMNTSLNAGANYAAQIQFGTCNGNYSGAGQAWIDYNQNQVFEASESIGTWTGIPPTALSIFNFTVPGGASNGVTRMRVMQHEGGTLPLNPCATFAWGSVMDFGITIGSGIDCSAYIGDDTSDPIVVSTLPYTNTGDNSYCYSNDNLVYNSPDVYYQVSPSLSTQSINVSLCGSSFDTFLSVVDPFGNIIAFNDDASSCGTQSSLTFDTEGLGLVYIIVEGWGSASGAYTININANYLGQEELENDPSVIFPNPTSDLFTIQGVQGTIELYDLTGKLLKHIDKYDGENISVLDLAKGIYTIQYQMNNEFLSKKLMVH